MRKKGSGHGYSVCFYSPLPAVGSGLDKGPVLLRVMYENSKRRVAGRGESGQGAGVFEGGARAWGGVVSQVKQDATRYQVLFTVMPTSNE